jgi:hypothetical protein
VVDEDCVHSAHRDGLLANQASVVKRLKPEAGTVPGTMFMVVVGEDCALLAFPSRFLTSASGLYGGANNTG